MRIRRHTASPIDWSGLVEYIRGLGSRLWIIALASVVGAFAVGYLVAVFVIFPAPIFASEKVVPHLFGMDAEIARTTLADAGLNTGDVTSVNHPSAPRGAVVW